MSTVPLVEPKWLQALAQRQPRAAELLSKSPDEQQRLGYFHTLREICQQPSTWLQTCESMQEWAPTLGTILKGISALTLTGSGTSEYAGQCVSPVLQSELGIDAQAIGGGTLLTYGGSGLPVGEPALVVSLARSGNSPESTGVLSLLLKTDPEVRHLVLTCNAAGNLATTYRQDPRVAVVTLDEATNDRGLVMTSSFTNLVLAARFLGLVEQPAHYQAICQKASRIASDLINQYFGEIAKVAKAPFKRAVFLGSGPRFGAARESALKLLEMTDGRISTLSETYLGLRHGPMSYVHDDTIVVCFLSSHPILRAYETDLLRELQRKELGLLKVIVGENIPVELTSEEDLLIDCPGLKDLGDENCAIVDVLVGQLLAFFRSLDEGLRPDSPSKNGVISRVVESFTLHLPPA